MYTQLMRWPRVKIFQLVHWTHLVRICKMLIVEANHVGIHGFCDASDD